MLVDIDKDSGFCFGVVYAVEKAEKELEKNEKLYSLGDIVHNSVELSRLEKMGLKSISHKEFKKLKNCKVLIRAHGEPPETYKIAKKNNIKLIDATCPVVLQLQNKIMNGYRDISKINGQIVIFGKKGHAEVNGLVGQTDNKAIVVETINDIEKIDFSKPVILYSQTTKSTKGFNEIKDAIDKKFRNDMLFVANNTICQQVSMREPKLKIFANKYDVIIFVSGRKSSNGKMLYSICKNENKNTYFVSNEKELDNNWFNGMNSVGICGATSTPRWLMKKISEYIKLKY